MVRRGEYLERAVIIPAMSGALEGLYHRGAKSPPVLILPPHPHEGGSMEVTVIAELAWALTRAGHATLRFNYRGVGASQGERVDGALALDDARAAADQLRATAGAARADQGQALPLALAGVGEGARVAAALAMEESPPPELVALIGVDPARLPDAFWSYPGEVLFVQPGGAPEARARAQSAAERLARGRWCVIPAADPTYRRGLVELGRVVAEAIDPPGQIVLD